MPAARPVKSKSVLGSLASGLFQVKDSGGQAEPLAISGASILSSTTRADGFVLVPRDSEGYPAGAAVQVFLYD